MSLLKKVFLAFLIIIIIGGIGSFIVIRKLSDWEAAQQAKRPDIQITIPEGWRREEIAIRLQELDICTAADFLAVSRDKEGYLFPDTYRFYANTPASEVLADMTQDYTKKTASLNLTADQLSLASIIEREAKTDEDRYLIAGVYTNRLKVGMKLDADPTVQYAKDTLGFAATSDPLTYSFWKPITQADYTKVVSPFNTYLQTGLPPHPIANPGKKSILAAISPAQHEYYYFLYRNNQLLLSKTLAEHQSKQ